MLKAERPRGDGDAAGTFLTPRRRLAFGLGLALVFCWSVALLMPHARSPISKPLSPISTPGELDITAPNEQQPQDETKTPSQGLRVSDIYSVKPIAYIFPQFHAIPENDKFWGANFTEWTFVKTATKNRFGQDVLRPAEDVGYYNLLEYATRTRYADLLREMGFYGICYHHYWFEGPIMDKALFALLEDGQPDVPFMLSWANEPWTKHWDGQDSSETLLKQEYGDLHNWRRHFEYLLPFFEHPLYIRVNGKPQFVAYNLGHMGEHAPPMFTAFKQWALEAGLPGLDIIQTKDAGISNRGDADAINEFHPRSSGSLDQTSFAGLRRISRVYHRGLLVGFDNTPRHQTDGSARINPWTHPDLWKQSVLSVIGHIKKDPNPPGEENFLFINALNEWGEGNVLEPTIQWDRRFPTAFREAVEEAKAIPWRQDLIQQGYQLETELASAGEPAVDVCVLVRTFRHDWAFEYPWTLWDHLRSLQEQRNPRWRAVVYSVVPHEGFVLRNTIKDTFDPRIQYAEAPGSVFDAKGDPVVQGWNATKWVLGDLGTISPACHGAKYIMIADSNTTLAAHTFDEASTATDDIVGLNFVSEESMRMDQDKPMTWDQRCTRFLDGTTQLCQPNARNSLFNHITAALFRTEKLLQLLKKPRTFSKALKSKTSFMHVLANKHNWTWADPSPAPQAAPEDLKATCHVVHGWTYPGCASTGRMWLDVPEADENHRPGCHQLDGIGHYFGNDLGLFDMERWKTTPFCLRLNQEKYGSFGKKD